jgi:hypothetical protein
LLMATKIRSKKSSYGDILRSSASRYLRRVS